MRNSNEVTKEMSNHYPFDENRIRIEESRLLSEYKIAYFRGDLRLANELKIAMRDLTIMKIQNLMRIGTERITQYCLRNVEK